MLCPNCASIDLEHEFGPIPDPSDAPLPRRSVFSAETFHYESYAGIIKAAGSCQLCALVAKGFDAPFVIRPSLEEPIYRSLGREEYPSDMVSIQARQIRTMRFGGENCGGLNGMNYCEVELYVQEGTLCICIMVGFVFISIDS
jgi:hypothetical protein